jgi:hypothetical protein
MAAEQAAVGLRDSHSVQTLCMRCEAIDFVSIFAKRITRPRGHRLLSLGNITRSLDISSCPLCRFFARTSLGSNQNHNLYAVSSVRAFLVGYNPFQRKLPGLSDTVCLGLFPESDSPDKRQVPEFIAKSCPRDVARGPQVRVRTLESATIDFDILKGWYAFCRDYHTRLCNSSRPVQTPMLRVIDCALREVIGADDDCSYAALSYVWGSPTS